MSSSVELDTHRVEKLHSPIGLFQSGLLSEMEAGLARAERAFHEDGKVPETLQRELTHSLRVLESVGLRQDLSSPLYLVKPEFVEPLQSFYQRARTLRAELLTTEKQNLLEVDFETITAGVSEEQLLIFGRTIVVVQLSTGCSVCCPDCNVNALLMPRRHVSWDAVNKIVDCWGDSLNKQKVLFYYASDPLDWASDGKNYLDLVKLISDQAGYAPYTTTAVPIESEELFAEYWQSEFFIRVSISGVNSGRLLGIDAKELPGMKVDSVEARLIEKFGAPGDGASHVIGSSKDPDRRSDKERKMILREGGRLPYQTGRSYDYLHFSPSIGCVNGSMLSPDGLFRIVSTHTTPFTPDGHIRFPVDAGTKYFIVPDRKSHGEINAFKPYVVQEVNGNHLALSRLMEHQCFQAIFELVSSELAQRTLVWPHQEFSKDGDIYQRLYGYQRPVPEHYEAILPDLVAYGEKVHVEMQKYLPHYPSWEGFYPDANPIYRFSKMHDLVSDTLVTEDLSDEAKQQIRSIRGSDYMAHYYMIMGFEIEGVPDGIIKEEDAANLTKQFLRFIEDNPAAGDTILAMLEHDLVNRNVSGAEPKSIEETLEAVLKLQEQEAGEGRDPNHLGLLIACERMLLKARMRNRKPDNITK